MLAEQVTVNKKDIVRALQEVGVSPGGSCIIHSSMKSFGYVEGGPQTVIEAAKSVLTKEGDLIFPTLVQKDFANAYKNWDREKTPSDVGLISEVFRTSPDTVRSDQATHSVAAWGRNQLELTQNHCAYGPRMGVFGDYAFSWSSPWQWMFFHNTTIVFLGARTNSNTFKHFMEYCLIDEALASIGDKQLKCRAMAALARHNVPGVWPFVNASKAEVLLREKDLIKQTSCGLAQVASFLALDYYNTIYPAVRQDPGGWAGPDFANWWQEFISPGPDAAGMGA